METRVAEEFFLCKYTHHYITDEAKTNVIKSIKLSFCLTILRVAYVVDGVLVPSGGWFLIVANRTRLGPRSSIHLFQMYLHKTKCLPEGCYM